MYTIHILYIYIYIYFLRLIDTESLIPRTSQSQRPLYAKGDLERERWRSSDPPNQPESAAPVCKGPAAVPASAALVCKGPAAAAVPASKASPECRGPASAAAASPASEQLSKTVVAVGFLAKVRAETSSSTGLDSEQARSPPSSPSA